MHVLAHFIIYFLILVTALRVFPARYRAVGLLAVAPACSVLIPLGLFALLVVCVGAERPDYAGITWYFLLASAVLYPVNVIIHFRRPRNIG